MVAMKRTRQRPGLKLKSKFLGPYKVTKIKDFNTYIVQHMDKMTNDKIRREEFYFLNKYYFLVYIVVRHLSHNHV